MITEQAYIDKKVLERFLRLEKSKRLAHAYLFVGPLGIGKGETATAVAKLFNCQAKDQREYFCDQCDACKNITAGMHPDVHVLECAYGESIKIEQIREALNKIKLKPYYASKKIFVLKNVENISTEGANAILKTLEEPSDNSLLLLTTSVPEGNLDTIISRCHLVRFLPEGGEVLEKKIKTFFQSDGSSAHYLAYFSEGCFSKAKRMGEDRWFQKKNELLDQILFSRDSEKYIKEIVKEKDKTKELLDVLLSWIRDCIMIKQGMDEAHIVNIDKKEELQVFSSKYSFNELVELNEEILTACKLLSENLNIKIPISVIKEKLWQR